MSSTNNPVYLRWDQLLQQRYDILRSIIENSDKELMAAVVAHDRLSAVDWEATLHNHVQGPSTTANKSQVLQHLQNRLEQLLNKDLKADTDTISTSMERMANKDGATSQDWENVLDNAIKLMKTTAYTQLTETKRFADDKIESLADADQIAVTQIFTRSWIAPTGYQSTILIYLMLARQNIDNWTNKPWKNVKDFQKTALSAFTLCQNTISNAFPKPNPPYIHTKGPSTLADKDDVLRTLKDILLKTNQLIQEDTNEISRNFEQLANKGGNKEEWVRALDRAEDLMRHKALDQMTEMKKFAIDRINSVDAKYRNKVGDIFGNACTALAGFQGSVHLFITVAKTTPQDWDDNPWKNVKIFEMSTKTWYASAEQGIKRAFPEHLVSDNGRGEDSLSAISAQANGPSTLATKNEVLKVLKPLLIKTNDDLKEDTDEILGNMKQLANNNKATKQQWLQLLHKSQDTLQNKSQDKLTDMKSDAYNRINAIDGKRDLKDALDIFDTGYLALISFHGSASTSLMVAEKNINIWLGNNTWDIVKKFQKSTSDLYDGVNVAIRKVFPNNKLGRKRTGEESLSAIQDMATKLQAMGVDNITIIPKGDAWALEIGAGM